MASVPAVLAAVLTSLDDEDSIFIGGDLLNSPVLAVWVCLVFFLTLTHISLELMNNSI